MDKGNFLKAYHGGVTQDECKINCDGFDGCQSFVYCSVEKGGSCYLRDKLVPRKTSKLEEPGGGYAKYAQESRKDCVSYYNACEGGN